MPRRKREYRKLARARSVGIVHGSRHSLWVGADHLLSVSNQGYTEDYKRFFFDRIQALLVVKTSWGTAMNAILGFLTLDGLVLLLAGWAFDWGMAAYVAGGVMAATFGVGLLANLAKGPTCRCFIRTAVQTERLYALDRLRYARKVQRRLRELVEQCQGVVEPEDLHTGVTALLQRAAREQEEGDAKDTDTGQHTYTPSARSLKPVRHVRHDTGNIHAILFGVLLVDFALCLMQLFVNNLWVFISALILTVLLVAAVIGALIRQRDSDLPGGIRVLT